MGAPTSTTTAGTTTARRRRRALRPAHAAQQERSRSTLQRILAAAERLLEDRDFEALTMSELAAAAGCGVGTVYGRIPNKDSLLLLLHDRYIDTGLLQSGALFAAGGAETLAARAAALCALLVDFLARRRGVTRAIVSYLYGRPHPEVAGIRRRATAALREAAAWLAERVDGNRHPNPQRASEFALVAAHDVAQSRLVFGERSGLQLRYARHELVQRLTDLVTRYLGAEDRPHRRSRR